MPALPTTSRRRSAGVLRLRFRPRAERQRRGERDACLATTAVTYSPSTPPLLVLPANRAAPAGRSAPDLDARHWCFAWRGRGFSHPQTREAGARQRQRCRAAFGNAVDGAFRVAFATATGWCQPARPPIRGCSRRWGRRVGHNRCAFLTSPAFAGRLSVVLRLAGPCRCCRRRRLGGGDRASCDGTVPRRSDRPLSQVV